MTKESDQESAGLHPLLQELQLADLSARRKKKSVTTALDVLSFLLRKNAVTEDAVRAAHRALTSLVGSEPTTKVETRSDDGTAPMSSIPTPSVRRRHIALRICYDGGNYSGLAENVGMEGDKSVEKELFAALTKARLVESRNTCGYSRSGRTDRGVSAAGQVIALNLKSAFPLAAARDECGQSILTNEDLPKNSLGKLTVWVPPKNKFGRDQSSSSSSTTRVKRELTEYAYDKILNNLLPDDIRILAWSPVSDDFSARFSTASRTYRYFFVPRQMNLDRMREGLRLLVGTHDFRNFCKMDVQKVYNFERKIQSADVVVYKEDICFLQITGQAFLWHQIRCIASVLFLIGRGLEEPTIITELLNIEKHPGKPSYPLADERPLVLHDCQYSNLQLGYSVVNLWNVVCQQERQWEDLLLAAARVRNSIESLLNSPILTTDLAEFYLSRMELRNKKGRRNDIGQEETPLDATHPPFQTPTVSWREALEWLGVRGLIPDSDSAKKVVYRPLLERSKGTTYEEKVASLRNSSKRQQKYEENVVKKRKTKEEDEAFYAHKIKQGGSAV